MSYLDLLVADGAFAVWPLEDNAATQVVVDAVGTYPLAATISNTSALAGAPIGPEGISSIVLSGRGDGGTAPEEFLFRADERAFSVQTGDFSWEIWFKVPTISASQILYTILYWGNVSTDKVVFIGIYSTGGLYVDLPAVSSSRLWRGNHSPCHTWSFDGSKD